MCSTQGGENELYLPDVSQMLYEVFDPDTGIEAPSHQEKLDYLLCLDERNDQVYREPEDERADEGKRHSDEPDRPDIKQQADTRVSAGTQRAGDDAAAVYFYRHKNPVYNKDDCHIEQALLRKAECFYDEP